MHLRCDLQVRSNLLGEASNPFREARLLVVKIHQKAGTTGLEEAIQAIYD